MKSSVLKKKFFYFRLCWAFVAVQAFNLVAMSKGSSLLWLLIAVAALIAKHGL